jgi:hypothetical protein
LSGTASAWKARVEVRRARAAEEAAAPPAWKPFPGSPQERAYHSPADITGYGGAAGGGKSDLELGLALTAHRNAIIFRREYPQLRGLTERSRELVGDRGSFNENTKLWRLDDGRTVEFGAVQHEHDVGRFRGRPHDLICFDEATEFLEFQVRFLLAWLRTTVPGQRCRAVLTFNPPTTVEGEWVIPFFGPWLDEAHPNPALPGELRHFAMVDGEEVERPDGRPFVRDGETIRPLSRTFFPARLADNPALAATSYGSVLLAMPEPLRSQLYYGDFSAGLKEDAWQVIPKAWAKAAMARWREGGGDGLALTCIGMDIAQGGRDKTVLAPRYGTWFDRLDVHPGEETPDGSSAASLVLNVWRKGCCVNIDVIGVGSSPYERLVEHRVDASPINFAEGSDHTDRSGAFRMRNMRAEAYWRLREALDPEFGEGLALPPDNELLGDLTAYKFRITPGGILIEDKQDVAARLRRSTDRGDAVALAMIPRRAYLGVAGYGDAVPVKPDRPSPVRGSIDRSPRSAEERWNRGATTPAATPDGDRDDPLGPGAADNYGLADARGRRSFYERRR